MSKKTIPPIYKLIIAILVCEAVGITSALLSNTNNNAWFNTLIKPSWNPPAYLFGPVWTILYLLMGIALWLVWKSDAPYLKKTNAMSIFFFQLFFNFCWSILFFRFHSPLLALINIVIMIVTITATMFSFATINRRASWLLVPYIMWVSFATLLNFTIWVMN
jgi:translocator protein